MKRLLLILLFVPMMCSALAWERIDVDMCRLSIPDGWIVRFHMGNSNNDCRGIESYGGGGFYGPIIHTIDPKHLWKPE